MSVERKSQKIKNAIQRIHDGLFPYGLFPYKALGRAIEQAGERIGRAIEQVNGVSEASPEQAIKIEKAKNDMNIAYSKLGDEKGENVTIEQIRDVLRAELNVSGTSLRPHLYFNKTYIESALELKSSLGLTRANTFMKYKADCWREDASNLPDILRSEPKRREKACNRASELLTALMFKRV